MTDEVLNKANDLADKIKKLDDSIYKVEQEIRTKKRFDTDIIDGRKPSFYYKWLDKFGSVFLERMRSHLSEDTLNCIIQWK